MIYFLKNLNSYKLKAKSCKLNAGMSYIELIVVLSIFAIMSTVVMFNYGDFQARVDLKNLASDIALQVVTAQKSSLSGVLPTQTPSVSPWKPSYGVYFVSGTNNFTYFVDLNSDNLYDGSVCGGLGECLNKITITKNNTISRLEVFYLDGSHFALSDLTVTFTRPNSGTTIRFTTPYPYVSIDYVQITTSSPKGSTALIKLYSSGRIQVN